MIDKFLLFILNLNPKVFVIFVLCVPYSLYYGVYALFGNKVMTKTNGMTLLSTEAAIINIVIGILAIIIIIRDKD